MKRLLLTGLIGSAGMWGQSNIAATPAVRQLAISHSVFQNSEAVGLAEETRGMIAESWAPNTTFAETYTERKSSLFRWPIPFRFRFVSKGAGIHKISGFIFVIRLPNLRHDQLIISKN